MNDFQITHIAAAIRSDEERIQFFENVIRRIISQYVGYLNELEANLGNPDFLCTPAYMTKAPTELACLLSELNADRRRLEDLKILSGNGKNDKAEFDRAQNDPTLMDDVTKVLCREVESRPDRTHLCECRLKLGHTSKHRCSDCNFRWVSPQLDEVDG